MNQPVYQSNHTENNTRISPTQKPETMLSSLLFLLVLWEWGLGCSAFNHDGFNLLHRAWHICHQFHPILCDDNVVLNTYLEDIDNASE